MSIKVIINKWEEDGASGYHILCVNCRTKFSICSLFWYKEKVIKKPKHIKYCPSCGVMFTKTQNGISATLRHKRYRYNRWGKQPIKYNWILERRIAWKGEEFDNWEKMFAKQGDRFRILDYLKEEIEEELESSLFERVEFRVKMEFNNKVAFVKKVINKEKKCT